MSDTDGRHLFVSYVREESEEVDGLCAVLEAAQVPYWRDRKSLLADRKSLGAGDARKAKISVSTLGPMTASNNVSTKTGEAPPRISGITCGRDRFGRFREYLAVVTICYPSLRFDGTPAGSVKPTYATDALD